MSDGTKIEWTEATWNPITGCSVTSPGCTNCYAMQLAGTRLARHPSREGLTRESGGRPKWTGEVRFNEGWLADPLKWKRPRMIFVCAHGDLFHESVPDEWIDRVFAVMDDADQHTYQVLTKRSARMRDYISARKSAPPLMPSIGRGLLGYHPFNSEMQPPKHIWLGVSVEDQQRADERIPDLLATPAAARWLSCEPLLGPVDLTRLAPASSTWLDCLEGREHAGPSVFSAERVDWVVAGGESGSNARPMHPDWARSLRDQCAEADVPFFFKQWGEFAPGEVAGDFLDPEREAKGLSFFDGRWDEVWSAVEGHVDDEPDVYRVGKKRAGRLLDGARHDAFPAHAEPS